MAMFKAFKPSGMEKIARAMGYQGNMQGFQSFLSQDPMRQQQMQQYQQKAMQMARGGVVRMQEGGTTPPAETPVDQPPAAEPPAAPQTITDATVGRMETGAIPAGGVVQPAFTPQDDAQLLQPDTGTVTGSVAVDTAQAGLAQATAVEEKAANKMEAEQSQGAVNNALNSVNAAQFDPNDPRSKVVAAEQTESSVGNLTAAQGKAHTIDNPVQRKLDANELVEPTFNAEKAAKFAEQIQAAEATPTQQATVQGQLETLTANFDATNPPGWAAGALRAATQKMAARGLGASSMAGQALVQAAIESALPVAQADASTFAQFESQNLSNRQQRAMLAAEQRASFIGQEFDQAFQARVLNASKVSDIANMNFTAEQQVQLENSRAINTMNLANLSNSQALVMAEASALAQLDMANLSNRQQAAVMNAQTFLQRDMANLSNQQQTEMFKAQSRVQALFTDTAAENAARQFNASSQNQTDQFFANLQSQTSQFNAAQQNAQEQFNANQRNTVERFNAELNNQRDQFNAQNQLVIAQSNAQWRREIATADTAATNRANELNASAVLDVSKQAYDNLWQYYADTMEWAWTSAENEMNRIADMAIATLNADERAKIASEQGKTAAGNALGSLIGTLGSAFIGAKF